MIRTLLADEVRRVGSWLGALTGIAGAVVVLLSGVAASLGGVLGSILIAVAVLLLGVYAFGGYLLPAVFFYRSCYTTSAYLTGSIPLRGRTIVLVKFQVAAIAALIATLVSVALAAVVGIAWLRLSGLGWDQITDQLNQLLDVIASAPGWVLWGGSALLLLSTLTTLSTYYFAAAVGSESWINKLGIAGPVLVWVGAYFVLQLVGVLGVLLPIHLVWAEGAPELHFGWIDVFAAEQNTVLPLGVFLTLIILGVVALLLAVRSYDRRLDLR